MSDIKFRNPDIRILELRITRITNLRTTCIIINSWFFVFFFHLLYSQYSFVLHIYFLHKFFLYTFVHICQYNNYYYCYFSIAVEYTEPVFKKGRVYKGIYCPTLTNSFREPSLELSYQRYSHRQRQKSLIIVNFVDMTLKAVLAGNMSFSRIIPND